LEQSTTKSLTFEQQSSYMKNFDKKNNYIYFTNEFKKNSCENKKRWPIHSINKIS